MDIKEWYSHDEVRFEIVKLLKGRESGFYGKRYSQSFEEIPAYYRNMKIHNIYFLQDNFERFEFLKGKFNIYYSLAHYYNMPMFPWNLKLRKEQSIKFDKTFRDYMTGFDLGLDFDAHGKDNKILDIMEVYEDVKIAKFQLDSFHVPYTLKCSGSGFHINIDSRFWEFFSYDDRLNYFQMFIDRFRINHSLKTLCESKQDLRKVWKVAYSLDYKSGNVALPLSDKDFDKFTPDVVKPENIDFKSLINRGLLERAGDTENVKKMIAEYDLLGDIS